MEQKLCDASGDGDEKGVRELIASNADVDGVDEDGYTALMWTAMPGRTEVASVLITHDADVNMADQDGRTALIWAARNGHTEVASLLITHDADLTAAVEGLLQFYNNDHARVIQKLRAIQVEVAYQDQYGTTAVALATGTGKDQVVAILLACV
jgi:ankyrin repeat protein